MAEGRWQIAEWGISHFGLRIEELAGSWKLKGVDSDKFVVGNPSFNNGIKFFRLPQIYPFNWTIRGKFRLKHPLPFGTQKAPSLL